MKKTREFNAAESILHLLHRASQTAEEFFATNSGVSNITARQFIVLSIVAKSDNPNQTEICAQSGIDRSTLADIVRRLVARGLLSRRRTKEDARAYAVRVTDAGQKAIDELSAVAQTAERALLGSLSGSQRSELEGALRRIVESQKKSAEKSIA